MKRRVLNRCCALTALLKKMFNRLVFPMDSAREISFSFDECATQPVYFLPRLLFYVTGIG